MDYNWGLYLGIVTAFIIFFIIAVLLRKVTGGAQTGAGGEKYDERQHLARGKAYRAAYAALMAYLIAYGTLDMLLERPWCTTMVGCAIGICVSVLVFVVMCIFSDAYLSMKEKPAYVIGIFTCLGGVNGGLAAMSLFFGHDPMVEDGMLTYRCLNLIVFVMFIIILAAMLIKRGIDKRGAK